MLQITSPRRAETKLKYLAGSEAAMGAWIGDIAPETTAAALRAAIERADAVTLPAEAPRLPGAALPSSDHSGSVLPDGATTPATTAAEIVEENR